MPPPNGGVGYDGVNNSLVPAKTTVTLRYSEVDSTASLGGTNQTTFAATSMSLNGLKDPYTPLGGHLHRGIQPFLKNYKYYRVKRATLRWWVDFLTGTAPTGDDGQSIAHIPLFLVSQKTPDSAQSALCQPAADSSQIQNWPDIAGRDTKVTCTNTYHMLSRGGIEGPPIYFDAKSWKRRNTKGAQAQQYDPLSGAITYGITGTTIADPSWEQFAYLVIAAAAPPGDQAGKAWSFIVRIELMTTIEFYDPLVNTILTSRLARTSFMEYGDVNDALPDAGEQLDQVDLGTTGGTWGFAADGQLHQKLPNEEAVI